MKATFPSIRAPGAQQKALDKAYQKAQPLPSPPPAPTARVDAGPADKPGKRSFASHFTSPKWLRAKASERESATQSADWPKNANWDSQRALLDRAGAVAQLAEWMKLWEDKGNSLDKPGAGSEFARQSFEGVEVDIDRPGANKGRKTEHRDVHARRIYAFAMIEKAKPGSKRELSDAEIDLQVKRAAEILMQAPPAGARAVFDLSDGRVLKPDANLPMTADERKRDAEMAPKASPTTAASEPKSNEGPPADGQTVSTTNQALPALPPPPLPAAAQPGKNLGNPSPLTLDKDKPPVATAPASSTQPKVINVLLSSLPSQVDAGLTQTGAAEGDSGPSPLSSGQSSTQATAKQPKGDEEATDELPGSLLPRPKVGSSQTGQASPTAVPPLSGEPHWQSHGFTPPPEALPPSLPAAPNTPVADSQNVDLLKQQVASQMETSQQTSPAPALIPQSEDDVVLQKVVDGVTAADVPPPTPRPTPLVSADNEDGDDRSLLLAQIRKGFQLKKAPVPEPNKVESDLVSVFKGANITKGKDEDVPVVISKPGDGAEWGADDITQPTSADATDVTAAKMKEAEKKRLEQEEARKNWEAAQKEKAAALTDADAAKAEEDKKVQQAAFAASAVKNRAAQEETTDEWDEDD